MQQISDCSFRCGRCHILRSRIHRLFVEDANLKSEWELLSRQGKTDFMKKSHALMGLDLKAEMQEHVITSVVTKKTNQFEAGGAFMDKAEMEEKYKRNPDRLKNILQNTKKSMIQ